ncbi:MAG: DNA replication/repair protein RecF [Alphaproteobacteria bacterium]|nr:DNA replication/repair protein RecF [Alphaproteobacteria bacterium]
MLRLTVSEFRCYRRAEVVTDGYGVVLTGPNGAGKTNLLEAVSFLAPGRGLRRAGLAEIERHGATARWAVSAAVTQPGGPVTIGTGRDPDAGAESERRMVRIDGQPQRGPAVLGDYMALSWLTPAMDRLFADGSSARRRFVDRLALGFDPDHARRVAAYEQAMRERAKLLEAGNADPAWLDALEATMAGEGVAVAAARSQLVARLAALAAAADGPFPAPALAMTGELALWLETMPALEAEERLVASLARARRRDAETGRAGAGPHRDDLAVVFRAKNQPARLCSTGEQKAMLVAIVLAHARLVAAERGRAPMLLLDEIAAHLDAQRRAALFQEIGRIGCQAWMTGTDEMLFAPLAGRARFFRVADATVQPR